MLCGNLATLGAPTVSSRPSRTHPTHLLFPSIVLLGEKSQEQHRRGFLSFSGFEPDLICPQYPCASDFLSVAKWIY
jgi:hypothetical protein